MASDIYAWSSTASSNATADAGINWAENQNPSTVNDSARTMMKRIADFIDDIGGVQTAGGTADAITITAKQGFTALADGMFISFLAASDNTTAATLNVNAIGAKSIRKATTSGDSALTGGEIQAGCVYVLVYNSSLNSASGGWQLLSPTEGAGNNVWTGTNEFKNTVTIDDVTDPTKQAVFDVSGITTGTSRTYTFPDYSGTFSTITGTETLTNKTLSGPAWSGTGTGNISTTGTVGSRGSSMSIWGATATSNATLYMRDDTGTSRAEAYWDYSNDTYNWRVINSGGTQIGSILKYDGTDIFIGTTNLTNKMASAWVNFNGTGVVAINDSFNVSSITDNGTGNYTVNFTTALANTNYATVVTTSQGGASDTNLHGGRILTTGKATSSVQVLTSYVSSSVNNTLEDNSDISVAVFGG